LPYSCQPYCPTFFCCICFESALQRGFEFSLSGRSALPCTFFLFKVLQVSSRRSKEPENRDCLEVYLMAHKGAATTRRIAVKHHSGVQKHTGRTGLLRALFRAFPPQRSAQLCDAVVGLRAEDLPKPTSQLSTQSTE